MPHFNLPSLSSSQKKKVWFFIIPFFILLTIIATSFTPLAPQIPPLAQTRSTTHTTLTNLLSKFIHKGQIAYLAPNHNIHLPLLADSCSPIGRKECLGTKAVQVCQGNGWKVIPCQGDCQDGQCVQPPHSPNQPKQSKSNSNHSTSNEKTCSDNSCRKYPTSTNYSSSTPSTPSYQIPIDGKHVQCIPANIGLTVVYKIDKNGNILKATCQDNGRWKIYDAQTSKNIPLTPIAVPSFIQKPNTPREKQWQEAETQLNKKNQQLVQDILANCKQEGPQNRQKCYQTQAKNANIPSDYVKAITPNLEKTVLTHILAQTCLHKNTTCYTQTAQQYHLPSSQFQDIIKAAQQLNQKQQLIDQLVTQCQNKTDIQQCLNNNPLLQKNNLSFQDQKYFRTVALQQIQDKLFSLATRTLTESYQDCLNQQHNLPYATTYCQSRQHQAQQAADLLTNQFPNTQVAQSFITIKQAVNNCVNQLDSSNCQKDLAKLQQFPNPNLQDFTQEIIASKLLSTALRTYTETYQQCLDQNSTAEDAEAHCQSRLHQAQQAANLLTNQFSTTTSAKDFTNLTQALDNAKKGYTNPQYSNSYQYYLKQIQDPNLEKLAQSLISQYFTHLLTSGIQNCNNITSPDVRNACLSRYATTQEQKDQYSYDGLDTSVTHTLSQPTTSSPQHQPSPSTQSPSTQPKTIQEAYQRQGLITQEQKQSIDTIINDQYQSSKASFYLGQLQQENPTTTPLSQHQSLVTQAQSAIDNISSSNTPLKQALEQQLNNNPFDQYGRLLLQCNKQYGAQAQIIKTIRNGHIQYVCSHSDLQISSSPLGTLTTYDLTGTSQPTTSQCGGFNQPACRDGFGIIASSSSSRPCAPGLKSDPKTGKCLIDPQTTKTQATLNYIARTITSDNGAHLNNLDIPTFVNTISQLNGINPNLIQAKLTSAIINNLNNRFITSHSLNTSSNPNAFYPKQTCEGAWTYDVDSHKFICVSNDKLEQLYKKLHPQAVDQAGSLGQPPKTSLLGLKKSCNDPNLTIDPQTHTCQLTPQAKLALAQNPQFSHITPQNIDQLLQSNSPALTLTNLFASTNLHNSELSHSICSSYSTGLYLVNGVCWYCASSHSSPISMPLSACSVKSQQAFLNTIPGHQCAQHGGYCATITVSLAKTIKTNGGLDQTHNDCPTDMVCLNPSKFTTNTPPMKEPGEKTDSLTQKCLPGLKKIHGVCRTELDLAFDPQYYQKGFIGNMLQAPLDFLNAGLRGGLYRSSILGNNLAGAIARAALTRARFADTWITKVNQSPQLTQHNFDGSQIWANLDADTKTNLILLRSEKGSFKQSEKTSVQILGDLGLMSSHWTGNFGNSWFANNIILSGTNNENSNAFLEYGYRMAQLGPHSSFRQRLRASTAFGTELAMPITDVLTLGSSALARTVTKHTVITASRPLAGKISETIGAKITDTAIGHIAQQVLENQATRFVSSVAHLPFEAARATDTMISNAGKKVLGGVFRPFGTALKAGAAFAGARAPIITDAIDLAKTGFNKLFSRPPISSHTLDIIAKEKSLTLERLTPQTIEKLYQQASKAGFNKSQEVFTHELILALAQRSPSPSLDQDLLKKILAEHAPALSRPRDPQQYLKTVKAILSEASIPLSGQPDSLAQLSQLATALTHHQSTIQALARLSASQQLDEQLITQIIHFLDQITTQTTTHGPLTQKVFLTKAAEAGIDKNIAQRLFYALDPFRSAVVATRPLTTQEFADRLLQNGLAPDETVAKNIASQIANNPQLDGVKLSPLSSLNQHLQSLSNRLGFHKPSSPSLVPKISPEDLATVRQTLEGISPKQTSLIDQITTQLPENIPLQDALQIATDGTITVSDTLPQDIANNIKPQVEKLNNIKQYLEEMLGEGATLDRTQIEALAYGQDLAITIQAGGGKTSVVLPAIAARDRRVVYTTNGVAEAQEVIKDILKNSQTIDFYRKQGFTEIWYIDAQKGWIKIDLQEPEKALQAFQHPTPATTKEVAQTLANSAQGNSPILIITDRANAVWNRLSADPNALALMHGHFGSFTFLSDEISADIFTNFANSMSAGIPLTSITDPSQLQGLSSSKQALKIYQEVASIVPDDLQLKLHGTQALPTDPATYAYHLQTILQQSQDSLNPLQKIRLRSQLDELDNIKLLFAQAQDEQTLQQAIESLNQFLLKYTDSPLTADLSFRRSSLQAIFDIRLKTPNTDFMYVDNLGQIVLAKKGGLTGESYSQLAYALALNDQGARLLGIPDINLHNIILSTHGNTMSVEEFYNSLRQYGHKLTGLDATPDGAIHILGLDSLGTTEKLPVDKIDSLVTYKDHDSLVATITENINKKEAKRIEIVTIGDDTLPYHDLAQSLATKTSDRDIFVVQYSQSLQGESLQFVQLDSTGKIIKTFNTKQEWEEAIRQSFQSNNNILIIDKGRTRALDIKVIAQDSEIRPHVHWNHIGPAPTPSKLPLSELIQQIKRDRSLVPRIANKLNLNDMEELQKFTLYISDAYGVTDTQQLLTTLSRLQDKGLAQLRLQTTLQHLASAPQRALLDLQELALDPLSSLSDQDRSLILDFIQAHKAQTARFQSLTLLDTPYTPLTGEDLAQALYHKAAQSHQQLTQLYEELTVKLGDNHPLLTQLNQSWKLDKPLPPYQDFLAKLNTSTDKITPPSGNAIADILDSFALNNTLDSTAKPRFQLVDSAYISHPAPTALTPSSTPFSSTQAFAAVLGNNIYKSPFSTIYNAYRSLHRSPLTALWKAIFAPPSVKLAAYLHSQNLSATTSQIHQLLTISHKHHLSSQQTHYLASAIFSLPSTNNVNTTLQTLLNPQDPQRSHVIAQLQLSDPKIVTKLTPSSPQSQPQSSSQPAQEPASSTTQAPQAPTPSAPTTPEEQHQPPQPPSSPTEESPAPAQEPVPTEAQPAQETQEVQEQPQSSPALDLSSLNPQQAVTAVANSPFAQDLRRTTLAYQAVYKYVASQLGLSTPLTKEQQQAIDQWIKEHDIINQAKKQIKQQRSLQTRISKLLDHITDPIEHLNFQLIHQTSNLIAILKNQYKFSIPNQITIPTADALIQYLKSPAFLQHFNSLEPQQQTNVLEHLHTYTLFIEQASRLTQQEVQQIRTNIIPQLQRRRAASQIYTQAVDLNQQVNNIISSILLRPNSPFMIALRSGQNESQLKTIIRDTLYRNGITDAILANHGLTLSQLVGDIYEEQVPSLRTAYSHTKITQALNHFITSIQDTITNAAQEFSSSLTESTAYLITQLQQIAKENSQSLNIPQSITTPQELKEFIAQPTFHNWLTSLPHQAKQKVFKALNEYYTTIKNNILAAQDAKNIKTTTAHLENKPPQPSSSPTAESPTSPQTTQPQPAQAPQEIQEQPQTTPSQPAPSQPANQQQINGVSLTISQNGTVTITSTVQQIQIWNYHQQKWQSINDPITIFSDNDPYTKNLSPTMQNVRIQIGKQGYTITQHKNSKIVVIKSQQLNEPPIILAPPIPGLTFSPDKRITVHETPIDTTTINNKKEEEEPVHHAKITTTIANLLRTITFASRVGEVRSNNEDYILSTKGAWKSSQESIPWQFHAVFDGMGGQAAGEVASQLAAQAFSSALNSITINPQTGALVFQEKSFSNNPQGINNLMQAISAYIQQHIDLLLEKSGTTFAGVFIINNHQIYVLHAGDSRVYKILHGKKLQQITKDDSEIQELIDKGYIKPQKDLSQNLSDFLRKFRHLVKNSFSSQSQNPPQIHVQQVPLQPDEGLVIVCDGVPEAYGAQPLNEQPPKLMSRNAQKGAFQLITKNTQPAHDNQSAIVISPATPPNILQSLWQKITSFFPSYNPFNNFIRIFFSRSRPDSHFLNKLLSFLTRDMLNATPHTNTIRFSITRILPFVWPYDIARFILRTLYYTSVPSPLIPMTSQTITLHTHQFSRELPFFIRIRNRFQAQPKIYWDNQTHQWYLEKAAGHTQDEAIIINNQTITDQPTPLANNDTVTITDTKNNTSISFQVTLDPNTNNLTLKLISSQPQTAPTQPPHPSHSKINTINPAKPLPLLLVIRKFPSPDPPCSNK